MDYSQIRQMLGAEELHEETMSRKEITYEVFIGLCATTSVIFVLLDTITVFSLKTSPYIEIDAFILIVLWADYITMFEKAKDKKAFFYHHIIGLISLIPINEVLAIIPLTNPWPGAVLFKLAKITMLLRIFRAFGYFTIINHKLHAILKYLP